MFVAGPQRRLFFACVIVGFASLLSLDLHFAPASLAAAESADVSAAPSSVPTPSVTAPASNAGTPMAARVVIPAPARVPTIVARFETASKEPVDQAAIRALATAMIEDHDVSIVLEGHSDTRGGDDYNHQISLERAEWVKARLVELGVSPERIETVGLGATRPLRSDDPDMPSVNRRVEVRWLGSAARDAPPPPRPVKSVPPAASSALRAPQPAKTSLADASAAAPDAAATTTRTSGSTTPALAAPDAGARTTAGTSSLEERRTPPSDKSLPPGDD